MTDQPKAHATPTNPHVLVQRSHLVVVQILLCTTMSLKHKYEYLAPYNSEIFTEMAASVPCIATCYNSELLASLSQVSALHKFCVRWLPNITSLLYTLVTFGMTNMSTIQIVEVP